MLAVLAWPAAAGAKDFHYRSIDFEVQVRPDGSLDFTQTLVMAFEGGFSWANLYFPTRYHERRLAYSDVSVSENGRPLQVTVDPGERFEIRWHYQARDEERTFVVRYAVAGALSTYGDLTELYYQLVGPGMERRIDRVTARVEIPPGARRDELRVWGHGPLSGSSAIAGERTFTFEATGVPPGRFVEIRCLFPARLAAGVPSDRYTLESIQAEEDRFVVDTIAAARRQQRLVGFLVAFVALGWLAGPLVWLLLWRRTWVRVGRNYEVEAPDYFREPPSELPPALVENLLAEGTKTTSPKALVATLFDLARLGHLEMHDQAEMTGGFLGLGTRQKVHSRLVRRRPLRTPRPITRSQQQVLELLFQKASAGQDAIDLDDLKQYLKKHPQAFQKWFAAWGKEVKAEAAERLFVESDGRRAEARFYGLMGVIVLLTANIPTLILGLILTPKLRRLTRAYEEEAARWRALRRFLKDFSQFKDLPPEAYRLWESYLVFGILWGEAEGILKALPIILSDERAVPAGWYAGAATRGAALGTADSLGRLAGGLQGLSSELLSASTSAAHYSSGGGGGFSGGGGGGAGGGGGGAG